MNTKQALNTATTIKAARAAVQLAKDRGWTPAAIERHGTAQVRNVLAPAAQARAVRRVSSKAPAAVIATITPKGVKRAKPLPAPRGSRIHERVAVVVPELHTTHEATMVRDGKELPVTVMAISATMGTKLGGVRVNLEVYGDRKLQFVGTTNAKGWQQFLTGEAPTVWFRKAAGKGIRPDAHSYTLLRA
jgi:hypothetical protein